MLRIYVSDIYRILIVQIFLLFCINSKVFSQCEACLNQVELLGEQLKGHVLGLKEVQKQKDSLITKTKILQSELQEYKLGLKLPFNLKSPVISKPTKIEDSVQPNTAAPVKVTTTKKNQDRLVDNGELKKLEKRIFILNKEISSLKNTIRERVNNEKALSKRITSLKDSVLHYGKEIQLLIDRNQQFLSRLDCIERFIRESKIPQQSALSKIKSNREKFDEYKKYAKNINADSDKLVKLLFEILNTYDGYKGEMRTKMCGDIELSYYCDYLTVEDYMNIAEIYGKNLEGAVYSLEGDNKINAANRIILEAAGKIMENGNYDQRTYISNNLSRFVTEERKSGSDFTEVRSNVDRVYSLYMEGKYLEALLLFDKYEKFLSDPDLNAGTKTRAMFSVGIILFWDLAGIQGNVYSYNFGDWVSKGSNINSIGKDLLTKVIDDKKATIEIRKNASIALSKYYHE